MAEHEPDLRDLLRSDLLGQDVKLPTSTLGRMGRTAAALLGSGGLIRSLRRGAATDDEGAVELDAKTIARVVSRFGRLKGIAMKMAQIMSYIDVALPEELRTAMSVLQTHAQPMPFDRVAAIIRSELGERAESLLADMEEAPSAAASIGQVHRSRLPDGTPVAVKVQYPEIERAIESDFGPAAFGQVMASLFYPGARIDGFIREARERFLAECDYLQEARWQQRFAAIYADHPVILVPAVHPDFGSKHVLVTTWVDGEGFEDFTSGDISQELRDRFGTALFDFYVGSLFRHGLYNCDPHPGNYLVKGGARLVMLDYGCAREFEPRFVRQLAALTRAVHSDERERIHAALLDLGIVRENRRYDYDTARELFRGYYGPMLVDAETRFELGSSMSMKDIAKRKRQLMRLCLPGEPLFLFRIRFGLVSVLARLGARANWYRLERAALPPA